MQISGYPLQCWDSQYYPSWKPFSLDEFKKINALYKYQGLNPSLRIDMKFKYQAEDPLQGSDLCSKIFGVGAETRYKQWEALVTLQCSKKPVPPKTTHPNFKVDPFLKHMQKLLWKHWAEGHRYLEMSKQLSLKAIMLINKESITNARVTDFLPMQYMIRDTHNAFFS